eukprot:gnl/TRDRNA2_/TRDRNA2_151095_c0_seq1.p1 gnl/TRDRNA2_/TRDRNA2_151095_c0~~gnl/TRDRNA2_/TRDRNA2_151095_c0_seq1.p1  ORF type:complete len:260 (-),score=44.39 gnl/TRDRNA2_/TRDRNA2_151095_c0_seq1:107-832(-)
MEDVVFAVCLKNRGIEVMNYGFLSITGSFDVLSDVNQEFIVNFHQARDALLGSIDGSPLERSLYWDAQPPPVHGCLLVAHPIEAAEDMEWVHSAVIAGPRSKPHNQYSGGSCVPTPMRLALQAQVRISAPGGNVKDGWDIEHQQALDRCFLRNFGAPPRCEWAPLPAQCYGLSEYKPANDSAEACAAACCRSGDGCNTFQFREGDGCWMSESHGCEAVVWGTEDQGWQGGEKLRYDAPEAS